MTPREEALADAYLTMTPEEELALADAYARYYGGKNEHQRLAERVVELESLLARIAGRCSQPETEPDGVRRDILDMLEPIAETISVSPKPNAQPATEIEARVAPGCRCEDPRHHTLDCVYALRLSWEQARDADVLEGLAPPLLGEAPLTSEEGARCMNGEMEDANTAIELREASYKMRDAIKIAEAGHRGVSIAVQDEANEILLPGGWKIVRAEKFTGYR